MPLRTFPHPVCRRWMTGVLIAASLLVGCGGGDDAAPDPLQKYREQTVEWTECDSTILAQTSSRIDELWQQAGERLRCGFVQVPLDWAKPERGDISIAVLRLAAAQPERRRGALLFNPGGPGGDGLVTGVRLWSIFARSDPNHPQGAQQLRLLDEYDIVGFSPRGTGASTQLHCATNEFERFVDISAAGWDTPENIANANYNDRKIAEACLRNPIAPYINTDAMVRDMDLLRGLMGDDKLNYVGYSYGTWLGAWYASLFPDKVGRMVLDSAMDFTSRFEEASLVQAPARQRLLDEVLAPYAARHADRFHLGATSAEVRAALSGLSPRMQAVASGQLFEMMRSRDKANRFLGTVVAARGLDAVLRTASPADPAAVNAGLQAHVFDPNDKEHDRLIRSDAEALFTKYHAMWVDWQRSSIKMAYKDAVYWTVQCNDMPVTTDLGAWAARVREIMHQAPLFFSANSRNPCAFWGGPKVCQPDPAPMKSLDVLFVQSQYDVETHAEGAARFFAQLPAARRIYVPGEFQHGLYPYSDDCLDPAVTSYLLGESPGERETVCPALPLELDAQLPNNGSQPPEQAASQRSRATPADAIGSVYKNPERARELIEKFKHGIGRPGLRRDGARAH